MATAPVSPPEGGPEKEKQTTDRRFATIVRSVMDALGRPTDFLKATVRPVGTDNFRVNVVTGSDAASARIAHSFFVGADEQGRVTRSTPVIAKHY